MAQEFTSGRFKSWLDSGLPNAGGRLYTYVSGTTTFKAAYTDATLATPCTYTSDGVGGQYIALNARGEAQVWLGSGAYSMVAQTALGVGIDSTDGAQSADLAVTALLASTAGAAAVGFLQAGTGAVAQTVQATLRERKSITQFGAVGDNVHDDYAAITAADAAVALAGGGILYFPKPPVAWRTSGVLVPSPGVKWVGESMPLRWRNTPIPCLVNCYGAGGVHVIAAANAIRDGVQISGIHFDGTNATAGSDGLYMDCSATGSSIEAVYIEDCAFANFTRHQARHNGNVFDAIYKRVSFLNPNVTASHCVFVEGTLPSQLTFDDCWASNYTLGTWAYYLSNTVDARFIGGTVAPYENTNGAGGGANGIHCYGGLTIIGTHIENRNSTQTANIGIEYAGDNGAFIAPSACQTFGYGVVIGFGSNTGLSASGWTIQGTCIGNQTQDVRVLSGGVRRGLLLPFGNLPTPKVLNQRETVDGVFTEVTDMHSGGYFKGNLQAVDGTAAAPSMSFATSPGSGFYNSAGDVIASRGGVAKMAIQAAGVAMAVPVYPPQDNGTLQGTAAIYAGSGVPSNANGANGSFYLRGDNPSAANQRLYVKSAGAWVGIL